MIVGYNRQIVQRVVYTSDIDVCAANLVICCLFVCSLFSFCVYNFYIYFQSLKMSVPDVRVCLHRGE